MEGLPSKSFDGILEADTLCPYLLIQLYVGRFIHVLETVSNNGRVSVAIFIVVYRQLLFLDLEQVLARETMYVIWCMIVSGWQCQLTNNAGQDESNNDNRFVEEL